MLPEGLIDYIAARMVCEVRSPRRFPWIGRDDRSENRDWRACELLLLAKDYNVSLENGNVILEEWCVTRCSDGLRLIKLTQEDKAAANSMLSTMETCPVFAFTLDKPKASCTLVEVEPSKECRVWLSLFQTDESDCQLILPPIVAGQECGKIKEGHFLNPITRLLLQADRAMNRTDGVV